MFRSIKLSRRECLRIIAASSLTAATSARVTGVQLYTVRAALRKDPDTF